MHYIYHIPERQKIGVTKDLDRRMKEHEWNGPYEILEQHDCGWVAGDRERELQKQYGYHVDTIHYMVTTSNKWNNQTRYQLNQEDRRRGDVKRRSISQEMANEIRDKYKPRKYSMDKLALEYGCTKTAVYKIIHNITHKKKGHSEE